MMIQDRQGNCPIIKTKKKREMLSTNPFSFFCAILLCFPLALILTITSSTSSIITPSVTHRLVTLANFISPPPPPHLSPLHKSISKSQLLLKLNRTHTLPTNTTTSKQTLVGKSSPPSLPPLHVLKFENNDDNDLIKQASRVNPNTTSGHPKKVAFLFLTTGPLPFAPLWEMFFNQSGVKSKGLYNVYIHADPMSRYDVPFTGVFSGCVIPSSKPTRRNTPTLCMAARRLLAHALLDDPNNYMFTLLSGACIPLHSFNFTYTTLVSSNKSFIEVLSKEPTTYSRWAARGDHAMLPEVSLDNFRIGSQFWTLTRHHARVVVEDTKIWRKFGLPCVHIHTCFPEENYFPTLLSMVDPHGLVPATLTNVNWRGRHDGHPRTYHGSEVDPGLIRWLRGSRPVYGNLEINGSDLSVKDRWDPFLFARKFAPNCLKPLLNIAKEFIFKE